MWSVAEVGQLPLEMDETDAAVGRQAQTGVFVSPIHDELLDAIVRLTAISTDRTRAQVLGPGAMREVLFHLLRREQGEQLRQRALNAGAGRDVVRAVRYIREFFRELAHDVVDHLLRSLGVPEIWAQWVVDVFRFELHDGGRVARGVPLNTTLSYLVAEALLRVVDLRFYRENDVRLIRFLDDIYFCCADREQAEAAYRTLCDAVTRLGLELNVEKGGAVCLRGELPAALPQAPLRFGFLRLEPDGAWVLDDEAVAPYLDALRESLERGDSVLAIVSNYNGYLNYMLRGVAPFVPLAGRGGNPVDHISAVARSVQRMHRTIVGGDTGNRRAPHDADARAPRRTLAIECRTRCRGTALLADLPRWARPVQSGGVAHRLPPGAGRHPSAGAPTDDRFRRPHTRR